MGNPLSRPDPNVETDNIIETLDAPRQSDGDLKSYRVIRLENGTTALLISESEQQPCSRVPSTNCTVGASTTGATDVTGVADRIGVRQITSQSTVSCSSSNNQEANPNLSVVSLSINVGSYSDPEEAQGLAHFLEHMLFMGSKEYPRINEFDMYIQKAGGTKNAETDVEHTTFYFSTSEKYLEGALKRFSQFFISPLMKKDAIAKELQALDSEFQETKNSDEERIETLLSSLGKKGHPAKLFSWGNIKSLKETMTDDELYRALHSFRLRHYSANRMQIAIKSNLTLNQLEDMVVENFKDVHNNASSPTNFSEFQDTFDTEEFNKLYYVRPVKNLCQVTISWSIPPQGNLYRYKPSEYVAWILGHEGHGSLLAYLRSKIWALALEVRTDEENCGRNSMFTMFTIMLSLTHQGMDNLNPVLDAVFSYLALLKQEGPRETIFNDLKYIEDIQFKYQTKALPNEYIMELSKAMLYCQPIDYLTGFDLFFEYNEDFIKDVIASLKPGKCNIMIMDSRIDISIYKETEKWFGTEYVAKSIPEMWQNQWNIIQPYKEFFYPQPNNFITRNFDILPTIKCVSKYPENIISNSKCELWYKNDMNYRLPYAYLYYYFRTPIALISAKHYAMLDLYIAILNYTLNEELYSARVAGLEYSLDTSVRGFELKINGFNDKLPLLANLITRLMKTCASKIPSELFAAIKTQKVKEYYNSFLDPSTLIEDLQMTVLLQDYWNNIDKYTVLPDITLRDLQNFTNDLFSTVTVQNIVQGNISEEQSFRTLNKLLDNINASFDDFNSKSKVRVVQIPNGEQCLCARSLNENDNNSIVRNYYQIGPNNIPDYCILEIIMQLMEEPLFNTLRTREHLGYDVDCAMDVTFGILSFNVTVHCQANKFMTSYVNERIEIFLQDFKRNMKRIRVKEFNEVILSLIKAKQSSENDIEDEIRRNWEEIYNDEYKFKKLEEEINFLQNVTLSDIIKWFSRIMKGMVYKKISFQIAGHNSDASSTSSDKQLNYRNWETRTLSNQSVDHFKTLLLMDDNNKIKHKKYFITDIPAYKMYLKLYPIEHHTLEV